MTARDRWDRDFKCPNCGAGGTVELSENDGWTFAKGNIDRSIDGVTPGFEARLESGYKVAVICACGTDFQLP